MPTLLENLALRKLAAKRTEEDETMRSRENMGAALRLVQDSPLAKTMFPEVHWDVLWHNLHTVQLGALQQVLVIADDDQEPDVEVRFLVGRDGGPIGPQYAVGIVDETYDSFDDLTEHVTIVWDAIDVGLWIEARLAERRPSFDSIATADR